MGTRNLTVVVSKKQIKVAQYCQWDGYPTGQGKTLAKFIQSGEFSPAKLRGAVEGLKLWDADQAEAHADTVLEGISNYADQQTAMETHCPELTRDTGARIVELIQVGRVSKVQLETEFAADSLFCEFAYVVDLDLGVVEVYQGFNKKKLAKTERFAFLSKPGTEYEPVRLLRSYTFDQFTVEAMDALGAELKADDDEPTPPKKVKAPKKPRRKSTAQIIKEVYSKPKAKRGPKPKAAAPKKAALALVPLTDATDPLFILEAQLEHVSTAAEPKLREAINIMRAHRGLKPLRTEADIVEAMASEVKFLFDTKAARTLGIDALVIEVLKAADVGPKRETERAFDGWVQAEELAARMIGEMLTTGRVNA